MWLWFALGSAVFAALTSILAKVGIEGVNSHLATAIRTMVVVAMAWGMVFLTNAQGGLKEINRSKKLDLPDSVWTCNGCVVAVRCVTGTYPLTHSLILTPEWLWRYLCNHSGVILTCIFFY